MREVCMEVLGVPCQVLMSKKNGLYFYLIAYYAPLVLKYRVFYYEISSDSLFSLVNRNSILHD
jgi:hypothetical protein